MLSGLKYLRKWTDRQLPKNLLNLFVTAENKDEKILETFAMFTMFYFLRSIGKNVL